MSEKKQAREWWIYDNGEYFGSMVSEEQPDEFDLRHFRRPEEIKHVIEKSAFDELMEDARKLRDALEFFTGHTRPIYARVDEIAAAFDAKWGKE